MVEIEHRSLIPFDTRQAGIGNNLPRWRAGGVVAKYPKIYVYDLCFHYTVVTIFLCITK